MTSSQEHDLIDLVEQSGDSVYTEHDWRATPAESDPSWGWAAGEPTSMDAGSIFVFAAGRVKEWADYG